MAEPLSWIFADGWPRLGVSVEAGVASERAERQPAGASGRRTPRGRLAAPPLSQTRTGRNLLALRPPDLAENSAEARPARVFVSYGALWRFSIATDHAQRPGEQDRPDI